MRNVGSSGEYRLEDQLGSGAFSSVRLARHVETQLPVAVKIIPKTRRLSESQSASILQEVAFLKQANHPNIISFTDFFEDQSNYYIVMELAPNGSLMEALSAHRIFSEATARRHLCQIISALQYLHNNLQLVHRDLKCENVLLDAKSNVKLADFGLSHSLTTLMETSCGTPAYAAPEVINGGECTEKIDIWSAGIVLYTMLAGKLPFDALNIESLTKEILYGDPVFPEHFSPDLIDLLMKMLCKSPEERISIAEILVHPFLANESVRLPDEQAIHNITMERLEELGISQTAETVNTPAYRIVRCNVWASVGTGLPALFASKGVKRRRGSALADEGNPLENVVRPLPLAPRVPRLANFKGGGGRRPIWRNSTDIQLVPARNV
jgi:serine/threonine protein kinase